MKGLKDKNKYLLINWIVLGSTSFGSSLDICRCIYNI